MELREQIAHKIATNFPELLLLDLIEESDKLADQILSFPLENWIVEEKCHHLQHMGDTAASPMEHSKFCECDGTGIITRPALLSDLEREDVRVRKK